MGVGLLICSQFILRAQESTTFFKRIPFGNNSDAATAIIEADDGFYCTTNFPIPIFWLASPTSK